jgi:hypothetical protein
LSGGERPSPPSCRSRAVKLGAAGLGRCRDWWQAAPTKPWRVGTARRRGCGKRGGKAYARNRCLRLSKTHRLEPGGSGPEATRTRLPHHGGGELPGLSASGRGGRGDVLRGSHGDVAGAESDASSAERSTSEHGNRPWSAPWSTSPTWPGGWAHRLPTGQGWDGAVVVVRGRESRSHGEGRQWFREEWEAVMPRDAAPNGGAPAEHDLIDLVSVGLRRRVSEMQAKLHRWAVADPGRRFDDLFPTLGPGQAEPTPGQKPWRARCVETCTAGSASGLGKRTGSNAGTAPQADSSVACARGTTRDARAAAEPGVTTGGWRG